MKIVIDFVLIFIVAACTWNGFKRGLIGGIAGILAIVISLYGGALLSSAFSPEIIPAAEPFVEGFLDSADAKDFILSELGYEDTEKSVNDILAEDPSLRYDYAYNCVIYAGLSKASARTLASRAVELSDSSGADLQSAVSDTLCDSLSYVFGTVIAFLLLLMLIVAIANLFNLSLRLPNMETIDEIGGSVTGFLKGVVYCILLCWALSFLGLILGRDTLEGTLLGRFFLSIKFLTKNII
ncbi:MAG: CvpA family protein [Oscillospiraceae bacterium]|nr:CvpA family protein [Oscillospiraceae bacterium]